MKRAADFLLPKWDRSVILSWPHIMMKALPDTELRESSAVQVESKVGAIIEIRFIGAASIEDVAAFEAKLQALVRRIVRQGKARPVLCTDLRACALLRPEVSERLLKMMKHDSPQIERNAFLGQDSALFSLQVQRLIATSGARERRRMFKEPSELLAWLTDLTTPPERARLRMFLDSNPALSA
jgi:hypothetical protein